MSAELAMLKFLFHGGVSEIVGDVPINRMMIRREAKVQEDRKETVVALHKTDIPRADFGKVKTLAELKTAVETMNLPLKKTARSGLFGEGNETAKVLFVDGIPTLEDDQTGKLIAGKTGNLWDAMLKAIDLTRQDVFTMPIVPYRPPAGRKLKEDERLFCFDVFRKTVELVKPDLVVTLGDQADAFAVQSGVGLKQKMKMDHPSAVLADASKKKQAWADLKKIKEVLGNDVGRAG